MEDIEATEQGALQFSMMASAVLGAVGVAFALASGSDAVLLDGVYSLVAFGMAFLATRISGLLMAPATVHFPFGKAALEPVVNLVRAGFIAMLLVYAAFSAVGALSAGGELSRPGPAVVYGVLVGLAGLWVSRRQAELARTSGSAILAVDAASWRADGAISLSVGGAFVIAILLSLAGLDGAVPYVDPATVLFLVAYLLREPVGEMRRATGELLVVAPPDELQTSVIEAVDRAIDGLVCEDREVKLWKLGRHLTVRVTLLVDDGAHTTTVDELDAIRARLHGELEGLSPALRVDVLFTADRRWLEPHEEALSDRLPV